MRELKRLWLHLVLLVVASGFALYQARPKEGYERPLKPGEVMVWGGKPDQVTRVSYSTDRQIVSLQREKDAEGAWYRGRLEPAPEKPDEQADAGVADGGKPKPRYKPKPVEPASFTSVRAAEQIAKQLAPLRAKRALGQIAAERDPVFGFDKPAGTLEIEVAGKKHTLVIGGKRPSVSSRYVRDADNKQVYVIAAEAVRDLEGGAGRLSERTVHEWKLSDVQTVRLTSGDNKRSIIRSGTEGRRFWADADKPETNNETAGNWLTKVGRLRPIKFLDKLPEGASKVVRVDFSGKDGALGFVEVYRHEKEGKREFFVTSERLRLYATVAKTVGEQVSDDLASLFPKLSGESSKGSDAPERSSPPEHGPPPGHGPPSPGASGAAPSGGAR